MIDWLYQIRKKVFGSPKPSHYTIKPIILDETEEAVLIEWVKKKIWLPKKKIKRHNGEIKVPLWLWEKKFPKD